jgi:hypothetical protein
MGYNGAMNKKMILMSASLFSIGGGYVPVLFGDSNMLDGWSILGGLIGGFVGIWLGVWSSKRWG